MNLKLIYVSLFSLAWAGNILSTRFVLKTGINSTHLAFLTLLGTSLILFFHILLQSPKLFTKGSKKSLSGAILSGIIGGGLANIVANFGLNLSTATNFGFLIKAATAFVIIFAYLLLQEPVGKLKAACVSIMLAGAYLISTNGQWLTPHTGDIFIILGAICFAIATVINRAILKKDIDPVTVSFYRAFMGAIISFVAVFIGGKFTLPASLIPLILLTSVFQSLTFIYLNKTLAVASASYMTIMSMAVPVITALVAMPLFKEFLSPIQILGALLIIGGGIATEKLKLAHHD